MKICFPYVTLLRTVRKPCPCSVAAVRQLWFTNTLFQVDSYACVFGLCLCELKVTVLAELFVLETQGRAGRMRAAAETFLGTARNMPSYLS